MRKIQGNCSGEPWYDHTPCNVHGTGNVLRGNAQVQPAASFGLSPFLKVRCKREKTLAESVAQLGKSIARIAKRKFGSRPMTNFLHEGFLRVRYVLMFTNRFTLVKVFYEA